MTSDLYDIYFSVKISAVCWLLLLLFFNNTLSLMKYCLISNFKSPIWFFFLLHICLLNFKLGISFCGFVTELFMSGKLVLTCWRAKYGQTDSLQMFACWCITYICSFLDAIHETLCKLWLLLYVCLTLMVSKWNTSKIEQLIFRYPDILETYIRKTSISLLKYSNLHDTNFTPQYWQPYIL